MTDYGKYWNPSSFEEAVFHCDAGALSYDEFLNSGAIWANILHGYMPSPALSIADLGCGLGRMLRFIKGKSSTGKAWKPKTLYGIDASPTILEMADRSIERVNYILSNGNNIPLPDGIVDFLYSLFVLQHIDAADVSSLVNETYRVLAYNGVAFLQFSAFGHPWSPDRTFDRDGKLWTGDPRTSGLAVHQAICYSEDIVTSLAEAAGFTDFEVLRHSETFEENPQFDYIYLVARKNREGEEIP